MPKVLLLLRPLLLRPEQPFTPAIYITMSLNDDAINNYISITQCGNFIYESAP